MTKQYIIRRMQAEELELAIAWAAEEGWNPGLYDAQCFYPTDPNGFFMGVLDNEPISMGSAVCYNDHFAFCGLYIVKKEYRHQGYGMQLTQERLRYVSDRMTGLDGVVDMVDEYAKIGYRRAHLSTRYQITVPKLTQSNHHAIKPLTQVSFSELLTYDHQLFPAPREEFLKHWIAQPECVAVGYYDSNQLQGYAVMRRCQTGYKVGPLFSDGPDIAERLLNYLLCQVLGEQVCLDIPEPNQAAIALAEHYQMQPGFQCIRMYRNGFPDIDLSRVFAITSFELG